MSTLLKMISSIIDDLRSKLNLKFSHELKTQISKIFELSQQLEMQTFTKMLDN